MKSESEVAIYRKVLRRHADLWRVAQLVCKARERGRFPMTSYQDFACLADNDNDDECSLDGERLAMGQAKRFFPAVFFPIEDEDDLITKLCCAFAFGARAHQLEIELHNGRRAVVGGSRSQVDVRAAANATRKEVCDAE